MIKLREEIMRPELTWQAAIIEMMKRPDKVAKLGKPAGFGHSSVKAPPKVVKLVSRPLPAAHVPSDDEDMIDLD